MNEKRVINTISSNQLKELCERIVLINEWLCDVGVKINYDLIFNIPEKEKHEISMWLDNCEDKYIQKSLAATKDLYTPSS